MDEELVSKIINKDESAFEELYNKYYKLVEFVVNKIVENAEITKDLTQDIFLQVFNKIDMYKEGYNFKYWLLAIAKNMARNKRNEMVKDNLAVVVDNDIVEDACDDAISMNLFEEKISKILDSETSDIVIKKIFFDYTFSELAKELNISFSSIYRKYNEGIKVLREHLDI